MAGRRPLMVGSELFSVPGFVVPEARSPSPHGRVGTCLAPSIALVGCKVAVPSWSGRNWTRMEGEFVVGKIAVPSWSGRNTVCWCRPTTSGTTSPSPHGRVGTWGWRSTLPVICGHRPLMVGSELEDAIRELEWEVGSPSPHGRVGT